MREGALFGTMFGLGVGAVLVGVTVSRLVVGQAPEKSAEEPPAAAAETRPALLSSAGESPAAIAIQRQARAPARKHRRPPIVDENPVATASVPNGREEVDVPPSADVGDSPIAVVRGGAVRPIMGSRGPGARVIQVDPQDGGH